MGKRLEGFKGGRHQIVTIKHEKRFKEGGKLCYGCDEVRKLEEYYASSTRCKFCMNKSNKKRHDKIKQPLW